MTREEIERFVRSTINADPSWEYEYAVCDDTVNTIVDRWMQDVADTNDEAWQRGVDQAQEA